MALNEDLLKLIPGPNPSGEDLRYNIEDPVYDQIKEARLEEDPRSLASDRERKSADYDLVVELATEAIANKSKDLEIAGWLTEAWVKLRGFSGLLDGIELFDGLLRNFWETVHPAIEEDGDVERRVGRLQWLNSALDVPLRSVPLVETGYGWIQYDESRHVGYESEATIPTDRQARQARIDLGKLTPEMFDKAFADTPKSFYKEAQKEVEGSIGALGRLDQLCAEKFGEAGPSFGQLRKALEDIRHALYVLLQRKLELEPDPVEEAPAAEAVEQSAAGPTVPAVRTAGAVVISLEGSSEAPDRQQAVASIAAAAKFLRQREPFSPAPYLLLRGLRWGELRAAVALSDSTLLEAPPTELRQHIKRLALAQKWDELLEAAESAMALPCSRAWLDLQRFVVDACDARGSDYEPIAEAIRSELKTLLRDIPQLIDANLLDDTPAANPETKAWLCKLLEATPPSEPETNATPGINSGFPGWPHRPADRFIFAQQALKAGQPEKALEIMRRESAQSLSGRERFLRVLQIAELCITAGKLSIAQPFLDDLWAAIGNHKLEEWEDPEQMASVLSTLIKSSDKIQGDERLRQQLFERICRLDPVRAMASSG